MIQTIQKILYLLTSQERRQAISILALVLIMTVLEMIGVASIMPFMAVITNPSLIETNFTLNKIYKISLEFGVSSKTDFFFFLGVIVFLLLVFSLIFKTITTYVQLRYIQMRQYSIGKRLITDYLNQPYAWFLSRHSANLSKTILSEAGTIVGDGIKPLMEIITKSLVSLAMIILLLIVDVKLALIVGVTLCISYWLIYKFSKNFLSRIGKERLKANELRFTAVSEAFGAAKEIKLSGLEETYIAKFSRPAEIFAKHQASSAVVGLLPRYALEAIAFGGLLLMTLFIIKKDGDVNSAIPVISLYAFAGYRLMPALQQIYRSFSQLRFSTPALNNIYEDLIKLKPAKIDESNEKLLFEKKITLQNIEYKYPNSDRKILKNVNLQIDAKTTVGFVGATGSGKTTIVDIILGLLEVTNGKMKIDEQIITNKNLRSWQNSIGYVPQHIFLADDSIASNIAFGENSSDIDFKKVEKCSEIANLSKLIVEELPDKYHTVIGERGIRLSGGQRQRIGIARALYNNPQVLILDEATSALDNKTEKDVMDSINNLDKNITVILIAHRLATVKKCDKIFVLDKGELKGSGTFEELRKFNEVFKKYTIVN